MKLRDIAAASLAFAACAMPLCSAQAAPITWSLNNVTFSGTAGQGSLSGSFDYDAATNTYANIQITNEATASFSTAISFTTFQSGDADSLFLFNGPPSPDGFIGRHSLQLNFATLLTDAGGNIDIASGTATFFTGVRLGSVNTGSISAAAAPPPPPAAPEPGAFALASLALAGLALTSRKCGSARRAG